MGLISSLFGGSSNGSSNDNAEECFGGIPKSALDQVADECCSGGYVSIRGDKLYYNYRSSRGHQVNHAEYIIMGGRLEKMTVGAYPGQTNFPDVDFMEVCNARFTFDNKKN